MDSFDEQCDCCRWPDDAQQAQARIVELEAENTMLKGELKSARDWMIGINDRAKSVASGTLRVLEELNAELGQKEAGDG